MFQLTCSRIAACCLHINDNKTVRTGTIHSGMSRLSHTINVHIVHG
jgi:hypothetical protein